MKRRTRGRERMAAAARVVLAIRDMRLWAPAKCLVDASADRRAAGSRPSHPSGQPDSPGLTASGAVTLAGFGTPVEGSEHAVGEGRLDRTLPRPLVIGEPLLGPRAPRRD